MYIERGRVWHTLTERNRGKKKNFQNAELGLISTLILALNIEHFIAVYCVCVPYNGSAGGRDCHNFCEVFHEYVIKRGHSTESTCAKW